MTQRTYTMPSTLAGALETARRYEGSYLYLAGGTDIQLHRKQGLVDQPHIIDLSEVEELRAIVLDGSVLTIGAAATLDELTASPAVAENFPLVVTAARAVATPVIRKTATVGGNLLVSNRCTFYNQSQAWRAAVGSCLRDTGDICQVTGGKQKCYSRNVSDLAPALIALDARVTIQQQDAARTIPLIDLYVSDGLHPHRYLDGDGLLTRVTLPLRPVRAWFRKLRLKRSLDFTSLTVAAAVDAQGHARVGINGVSMAPVLLQGPLLELTLDGLTRQALKACQTVENDLLPRKYRREAIRIYLEAWWRSVPEAASGQRNGPAA